MKIKVVIESSDEGGYSVYVPGLPGCISEGETREEALANIKEAIELYLEPVEDDLTIVPDRELAEIALSSKKGDLSCGSGILPRSYRGWKPLPLI